MKSTILITIFFLCYLQTTVGQDPLIKNYTIKDGLPTNTVYTSYQDSKGFIWFGTDSGVVKFNGQEFETFTMDDGLSCNEILDIKEDFEGRVWFMNLNGTLNFYKDNNIFNEENTSILGKIRNPVYWLDFFQDSDSTLYFYDSNSNIVGIKYNRIILKTVIPNISYLEKIYKSEEGDYLYWSRRKLYKSKSFNAEEISMTSYEEGYNRVFSFDSGENIIQGNSGKLHLYNDDKFLKTESLGIKYNYVNYILTDNNSSIWVGTEDQGITCYKGKKVIFNLEIKQSQNILLDDENNIWVTSLMNGIFKINHLNQQLVHIEKSKFDNLSLLGLCNCETIDSKTINGICTTNGSSIFFVKKREIYPINLKIENKILNQISVLNNNTIAVNGNDTPLYLIKNISYSNEDFSFTAEQKSFEENVWVKTVVQDLYENKLFSFKGTRITIFNLLDYKFNYFDVRKGRINNVFISNQNELIINASRNYIYKEGSLAESKFLKALNGEIILSHLIFNNITEIYNVNGQELFLLNDTTLYNLSEKLKYPINLAIKKIAKYDNSLFFSTIRNVYVVTNPLDVIKGKEINVTKLNIDFNNINDIACNDSMLYVASDDGLTSIPIDICLEEKEIAPKPYFDEVLIDNASYDYFSGSITSKSDQKIDIEFSSINYSSSLPTYTYLLDGVDKEWISGDNTRVTYQNLKPGTYSFKLKVTNNGKLYSDTIELPVKINPTFFQLVIVKIIILFLFLVFVFFINLLLYKRKLKRKEVKSQLVDLEHKALQSMMNPHFIFNALGSIQRYLLQNKANEAGTYLSQFARLIRQNMNSLKSNFISIDDEVERLRNYIELEQFRMDNKFEYKIVVDEKIDGYEVQIPSMIIQPFVENAIWHGVTPLGSGGLVLIYFKYINETSIQIIIEDNGVGISKSNTYTKADNNLNMGIQLTQKRIFLIGESMNVETKVEMEETNSGAPAPGTRIKMIVPITTVD